MKNLAFVCFAVTYLAENTAFACDSARELGVAIQELSRMRPQLEGEEENASQNGSIPARQLLDEFAVQRQQIKTAPLKDLTKLADKL